MNAPTQDPADMTKIVELEAGGKKIPFTLREGGTGNSFFSLGVRKSGSTLLHRMMIYMAHQNQVQPVDVPGSFFRHGLTVGDWMELDLSDMIQPQNLYLGFRSFPSGMAELESFQNSPKVFMFRDPRDALVSQYYSDAYSHSLPDENSEGYKLFMEKREEAQKTDINEWVLGKCGSMRNVLTSYKSLLDDPNCLLLRYENYVFQKRRLIHKVLEHFGWELAPGKINKLLEKVDHVPTAEDEKKFVRKAVPGDHTVKLTPETIRRLNNRMKEVMEIYDYY